MAVESIDFAEELLRRVGAAAIFFVHLHCRDRYEKDQGGFYI
jgi:hypothetical protein